MKRSAESDDQRSTPSSSMPGAMPLADAGAPAYPPAVPGRFWKGVIIGLCLTAAIGFGLYALWS